MEEKFRSKEKQLEEVNKQVKSSRMKEMKVAMETMEKKVARLRSLNVDRNNKLEDKNFKEKAREMTMTILRISEEKASLLLENNALKIELQRCLEVREKTKSKLEEMLKEKKKVEQRGVGERVSEERGASGVGGREVEDMRRELSVLTTKLKEKEGMIQQMSSSETLLKDKVSMLTKEVKNFLVEKEKNEEKYEQRKSSHKKLEEKAFIQCGRSSDVSDDDVMKRHVTARVAGDVKRGSRRRESSDWLEGSNEALEVVQAVIRNHVDMVGRLRGVVPNHGNGDVLVSHSENGHSRGEKGQNRQHDDTFDSAVERIQAIVRCHHRNMDDAKSLADDVYIE